MNLIEVNDVAFLFWLISCFMIGWYAREWYASHILKKLVKSLADIKEDPILSVYVKKSDEGFDVFNMKTDKFIVNVSSKDEMASYLKEKFPNTMVVMNKDNAKVFDESI